MSLATKAWRGAECSCSRCVRLAWDIQGGESAGSRQGSALQQWSLKSVGGAGLRAVAHPSPGEQCWCCLHSDSIEHLVDEPTIFVD